MDDSLRPEGCREFQPYYLQWSSLYSCRRDSTDQKMTLSRSEVTQHVRDSMQRAKIGKSPAELQNGKDFYKYFFTNFPDLRKYFKGAENFTAEDVQKSDRFEKQGARILLACWILCDTFEDEKTFRAYARETVNRHRQFKMEPSLWLAFFTVFTGYLESKGDKLTADQKAAWEKLGAEFNEECQSHLKDLGLPHA